MKMANKVYSKPEFAYILGVVYGDGFIGINRSKGHTGGYLGLKVKDKDFALEFKKSLESWSSKEAKFKIKKDFYHVHLYSLSLAELTKKFKLKEILNWNLQSKYNFMRGLFDSDGGIIGKNLDNRRKAKRWLHFSNNNKELIDLVSDLLREFGLKYSISKRIHSGFGSQKLQYEIKIYSFRDILYFYKNINFSIKRKQDKLKEVINSYDYYSRDIFNKAKELHKEMSFRKVAKEIDISENIVYRWLFKNYQDKIIEMKGGEI